MAEDMHRNKQTRIQIGVRFIFERQLAGKDVSVFTNMTVWEQKQIKPQSYGTFNDKKEE